MIFKIVGRADWAAACSSGLYHGSADDRRDGFIHFSASHQVHETAKRHFRGVPDLILVAFDENQLGDALKWEASRGGDLFPHLYGTLSTDAALWSRPLPLDPDGIPQIPEDLATC